MFYQIYEWKLRDLSAEEVRPSPFSLIPKLMSFYNGKLATKSDNYVLVQKKKIPNLWKSNSLCI